MTSSATILVLNSSAPLFWRSSEDLPSSSPLSNMMASPFLPSPSSPRSPFRWTCDKSWDKRNTTPQRVPCLNSYHEKARLGRAARTTARRRWGRARKRRTPGFRLRLRREQPQVRLDRRRQRGKLISLRHCDEWRTVGLAVLLIRFQSVGEISGHVILRLP